MKKSTLKRRYKELLSSMPSRVKVITGHHLPDLPRCANYMQLAGRAIALTHTPTGVEREKYPEYAVAHDKLYNLLYGEINHKEATFLHDTPADEYEAKKPAFYQSLHEQYYERVMHAYLELLREEAKLGCVRIPARYRRLHRNTLVTSQFTGRDLNYSPVMTEVPSVHTDAIFATAKEFTDAWLSGMPCSVVSVQLKKPVTESEYMKTQIVMKQVAALANLYYLEEFEERKDDIHYRHRDDDDPALF